MGDQERVTFVRNLEIDVPTRGGGSRGTVPDVVPVPGVGDAGAVVAGSVLSFTADLTGDHRQNVLDSTLLAQLASNTKFNATADPVGWYEHYTRVLQEVGWVIQGRGFSKHEKRSGTLELNKAALGILEAVLSPAKLQVLAKTLDALKRASEGSQALTVFGGNAASSSNGVFQLGAAEQDGNGNVTLGLGTFYFKTDEREGRFLFVTWRDDQIGLEFVAEQATLNEQVYAVVKPHVDAKLAEKRAHFVQSLSI